MKNDLFVTAGEVAQDLGVSKPFAYKLVRQMNEELEAKGFITIAGRVSKNTMKKNFMVWRRQIERGEIMEAYKDEQRGTWHVSFHYYDWTGKNCRKVKRGFKIKREAAEWERHFRMKEAAELDMTFADFVKAYTRDMKPKRKHNTWLTKEHILRTKLLPYFRDKKMRHIRPKDIIQWKNEQIFYRDGKGSPILRLM